ncbi:hypothetical protein J6590_049528 [Homalodisca vitripennis]|nr:hypothetical protein J6590_049528 [Homalodisca vitripennis]
MVSRVHETNLNIPNLKETAHHQLVSAARVYSRVMLAEPTVQGTINERMFAARLVAWRVDVVVTHWSRGRPQSGGRGMAPDQLRSSASKNNL